MNFRTKVFIQRFNLYYVCITISYTGILINRKLDQDSFFPQQGQYRLYTLQQKGDDEQQMRKQIYATIRIMVSFISNISKNCNLLNCYPYIYRWFVEYFKRIALDKQRYKHYSLPFSNVLYPYRRLALVRDP